MGNGYTRQSETEITDGETVFAGPLEDELDAIQAAFNATTGHSHDGTAGEGPKINLTTSVQGILSKAQGGTGVQVDTIPIASGTNNITVTANEAFVSYTSGKGTLFIASGSNTGPVQINMNSIGLRKAKKFLPDVGESELASQDIVTGGLYLALFDPTLDTGTGGFHVFNLSGYLPRISPTIQTSAIIQQLTGNESTLSFNSILGVTRTQAYWNSVDGKFYIKVLNSSGVQVGDPIVFDGTTITVGSWNSGQRISNAVLTHSTAYNVTTALTSDAWTTWPLSSPGEAYDPDGIVSLSSNQFTPSSSCLIDWRAFAVVSGQDTGTHTIKTRLYNVTDATVTGYGTLHGVGTNGSSGTIVAIGHSEGSSAVVAGKTYRIEYYATGGVAFSARMGISDGVSTQGDNPSLTVQLRTI